MNISPCLRRNIVALCLALTPTLLPGSAQAQSPSTNEVQAKAYNERLEVHWFGDNKKLWYRLDLPKEKHQYIVVDAEHGSRIPAFDHDKIAKVLGDKIGKPVAADNLPIKTLEFSTNGPTVKLVGDKTWTIDLSTYLITDEKSETANKDDDQQGPGRRRRRPRPPAQPTEVGKSPDGKWQAIVKGHNLFLHNVKSGEDTALSRDANPTTSYARDVERERAVEMQYATADTESPEPEVTWSPDSRKLVAVRTHAGSKRTVYYVESSPKDQLQPKLKSYPYLKPGDDIPIRKPHLFDVETDKEIALDDSLFSNPWSLDDIRWDEKSTRFTFQYNQRGHQVLRILAADATTGQIKPIVNEQSPTFIDYAGKFFVNYADKSNEILWMSERSGWNHLYLYDATTGAVKNPITQGDWVVRSVENVDTEKRQVWFWAGGVRPEQDPYYLHYCRVNFDGGGMTILTEGDGTHSAQIDPTHHYFVDTWSRVDAPPVHELRDAQAGKLILKLEEADISELKARDWRAPERFVAKGRDGTTDIYGVIHRPAKLDPAKKYPILENIYAGPQSAYVPRAFSSRVRSQSLLDKGFIIVQMDGMGTSERSKKFHDVCWKNLGDAGFPDRILWIKAAAAKYPYMDLDRVGLFGTSAGAQNALGGLLLHGDFYKAGMSDCGCHDNRMDKIWWNELWMGWPVGPHYDEQSNVTLAPKLQGKLLLMVGEADENVDPASTMQVVNALIKADKDFELLVVPGAGHGVVGTPYGRKKMEQFFVNAFLDRAR
ncbi:MAG TPA: DPP IV N-terminal domain-containing protein [Candidatus Limnocylindria bacterium]|nr:DPP IV N-terminal domain-containing protein [Candidatus Limnocylindria bacterium]